MSSPEQPEPLAPPDYMMLVRIILGWTERHEIEIREETIYDLADRLADALVTQQTATVTRSTQTLLRDDEDFIAHVTERMSRSIWMHLLDQRQIPLELPRISRQPAGEEAPFHWQDMTNLVVEVRSREADDGRASQEEGEGRV